LRNVNFWVFDAEFLKDLNKLFLREENTAIFVFVFWVAFLKQSLNRLQVDTIFDNI